MAGNAVTNNFMLGSATLMLGPVAKTNGGTIEGGVHALDQSHSLGLVKNVTLETSRESIELTQGIKQDVVATAVTAAPATFSAELFEYSHKNLNYALGIAAQDTKEVKLIGDFTVAAFNPTYDDVAGTTDLNVLFNAAITGLTANDYIVIKAKDTGARVIGEGEHFIARYVSGDDATNIVVRGNYEAMGLVTGDYEVFLVNMLPVGIDDKTTYYAMKIVGELFDGTTVVIECPKVDMTSGLNLAFGSDNFASMPVNGRLMKLVESDVEYMEFGREKARISFVEAD